ncbi:LysR family transcriptional regulator [Orbus wheelerorum]|uniref:LysR family transcriptional regulator n=1 Tax=Orbus wheelerorum TaxID=3074111 RepID=UPI00370D0E22
MKTNQILYFLAIIDHGGIRSASRALNISQSSIGKALSDLEQECGSKLLERKTNGGIALTETGLMIEPYFRAISLNMSWAKSLFNKTKIGDLGVLRVGLTPIVASTVLPEVYNWFRSRFKNVQLQFLDGLLTNVTPLLKSAKMDYAIALLLDGWEWDKDQIIVKELFKISHNFVARPDHPIFNDPNPLNSISHYEWLLTVDTFDGADDFVHKCINSQGILSPDSIMLVDTFNCYTMLNNTNSIAIVPSNLFQSAPGFEKMRVIPLQKYKPDFQLPHFKLVILKSPSSPNSSAGEFLMHCFSTSIKKHLMSDTLSDE